MAGGNRGDGGGEWTREPPDRTATRHRPRNPVGSGAERQRYRAAPIGGATATRRSRSAASPNEGGTAEGTTFRPGTKWSFLDFPDADGPRGGHRHDDNRSAQPDRGEAPRPPTPTRSCCAPRARPTSRRRSGRSSASTTARPGLPPRVRRGRRAARPLLVPGRRAAPAARGPRRRRPHPDPARQRSRPTRRTCRSTSPRRPTRSRRSAASCRAAASSRPRACPGSPAAPSGRSPTTRCRRSSRPSRSRNRDPVGAPTAAFIETDLVLVFDHLTHTLSAIASLHTEAPDFEGRYRIAEAAIFEALERTARPSRRRDAARPRHEAPPRPRPFREDRIETSLGRDEYIRAVEVAKDAIAAGEAIQVVLARRQSFDLPADPATGRPLDGIALYRALRRVNPSPYLFFVRTPSFEVVGASPELLLQVEGDR